MQVSLRTANLAGGREQAAAHKARRLEKQKFTGSAQKVTERGRLQGTARDRPV